MKVRLEKKNRVTIDFIQLETNKHLLITNQGKIGKSGGPNTTEHCGTPENAISKLNSVKIEYIKKNFVEIKIKNKVKNFDGVYDKAKWHYGGNFPDDLDNYQASVHSGMFIIWLIDNELFDDHGLPKTKEEVKLIKERKKTGANFYINQLDGVLLDDDISEIGNKFSYYYYMSKNGDYLNDYYEVLGKDTETLYHIQDTWENYDKLKPVIDSRFKKWETRKNKKWWDVF